MSPGLFLLMPLFFYSSYLFLSFSASMPISQNFSIRPYFSPSSLLIFSSSLSMASCILRRITSKSVSELTADTELLKWSKRDGYMSRSECKMEMHERATEYRSSNEQRKSPDLEFR
jgi:hypothetical protein